MTNVENKNVSPKETQENKENVFDKLREQRKGLSIETSENLKSVKEEKVKDPKKYAGISRPTLIENNNLRGGAPGKPKGGSKRSYEAAEAAVETIFNNFHPKSVIILEHNGESGFPKEGKNEASLWRSKGVKVIDMPIGGNEMDKLFFANVEGIEKLKINPKVLEAFKALDEGNSYVHCTHGAHRAVALVEMWRATRGIDRRPDMDANKNYNGSMKQCRTNAKKIIEALLALQESGEISSNMATPETPLDAGQIALIGDSIGEGISKAIANEFPRHEARAVSSARINEGEKYKPVSAQLEELDPKVTPYLVIQGGTNDIGHTNDPVTIAEDLKNLYEKAKSKGFKKVIVVTLTPHANPKYTTAVNSINAQLRILASQRKIELYDLNTEYSKIDPRAENISKGGVHPTNEGYKILAELLLKGVKEKLSEESTEKFAETVGAALAEQGQAAAGTSLQPEVIQSSQSTEHLSEKSKELQGKLAKEIEAITEEQRKLDEQKLSQAEIKDIRFNTALLNGDEDKVKEEMTHRLAQYTEKQGDGGLRLNYAKFNSSEHDHETNIGLGDVIPPEYKRIVVVTSGGEVRMGKRGIVSTSRESNRVGYIDESTGSYLATFTGDTVYVLDPPLTDEKELAELLAKEKEARKAGSQTYSEYKESSSGGGYTDPSSTGSTESAEADPKLASEYEEYLQKRNSIKEKLNPSAISEIPETPQTKEIPKKKEGVIRMAVFGDTDDKSHKTTKQLYLDKFQEKLPEWEVDFALGVGDYISATASSKEKYREVADQVRQEFKRFNAPYALAIGNHDRNSNGTDTMQDLYKDNLQSYEEVNGAYSYTLGNATFVVFNEGNKTITEEQTSFFEKKSSEAKGAVYLVNHIPPYQFAYGAGLPEDGNQTVKNFKKIQEIAKEKLESQGKPFYVISGDNHLATVIGNFMSPGGMAMNYYGLNEKRLKSVCSGAVVDIDKETGKVLAVYFRSADSNFEDPMPELQNAMAYGTELPISRQLAGTPSQSSDILENLTLKEEAINGLNKNIGNKKFWNYDSMEIKDNAGNILWGYNKSLSEGENIYNFSVAVCKNLGMEDMINVVWGIVGAESTFDPFDKNKKSQATGLGQPMHSTWESFIKYAKRGRDPFVRSTLEGQYGVGVEYPDSKGQRQVNLSEHRFPPEKDYLNYSRCNPFLNIYHTIVYTKTSIDRYQQSLGIDIRQFDTKKICRYLYVMHHDGHHGGVSMMKFLDRAKSLGINTENKEEMSRFMKSGTREADEALSLLAGDRNSSQESRARTDTDHFLNTWYETGFTAANYAMKGRTRRQETVQQPSQSAELAATGLTPKEKIITQRIRSMPKSNFAPDFVLSLGCGNDETNKDRGKYATELALKYNAFLAFSGGDTGDGISEAKQAHDAITSNPYYRDRLAKQQIPRGIENQSKVTGDNISNSADYIVKHGFKKIVIVTTDNRENYPGSRKTQAVEAKGKLLRELKNRHYSAQVSFYTPERPDIDKNMA